MPRTYFERELEALHSDLIRMGSLIEEALAKSVKALEMGDKELAKEIMSSDGKIDDLEKEIESRCLRLILRQQPVAKDLRAISTAIKMITDLERIGDQALDIADIVIRMENGIGDIASDIPRMAIVASEMVGDSIKSYINTDLKLAQSTINRDDEVDNYFEAVKIELIEILKTDHSKADDAINAMMIAKYFERIADHAVNVCEWVEFYETGRHKTAQIL